ncbi:MAG TPA: hypothetical protein VK324_06255 [Tepidisphaeraceae bacterium]|nr:hypothetical protein [Tepidisphaeraceae bacterium]
MRHPIIVAATVGGICLILACVVLVVGMRAALVAAADRLGESVREHAKGMNSSFEAHGTAVRAAGTDIATARVTLTGPVQVREPLKIRGVHDDGTLPVKLDQ